MSAGGASTMMAIVPVYVQSTSRLSPAMTRDRSDGVAPQRLIHRRIGNQYSTANASITRRAGTMATSFHLMQRRATLRSARSARLDRQFVSSENRARAHPRFDVD